MLFVIILVILIIHPYFSYPTILILLNKLKIGKSYKTDNCKIDSYVSIVIAAFNEERVIEEKLNNTLNLNYPSNKLEIIIGSDGSTDNTNKIVEYYSQKYSNVKLLDFQEREGKVNVLNKVVPFCTGDIIVFSDANAMYNQDAIQNIVRHFDNPHVGCVSGEKRMGRNGREDQISHNEGLYWKLESFIKKQENKLLTVIGADGALYAIRRLLFKPLPQDTSVDDFLLSMEIVKQGYKISYEENSYSVESSGETLSAEYKRKVRIAAGNFYNLNLLYGLLRPNLLGFMFFSHKILRWFSPFIFFLLSFSLLILGIKEKYFLPFLLLLLFTYILAFWGFKNPRLLRFKVVNLITYFYLTVLAQFHGYIKYCKGSQKAIWETVREKC